MAFRYMQREGWPGLCICRSVSFSSCRNAYSRGGTMLYRSTITPLNPACWMTRAMAAHLILVAILFSVQDVNPFLKTTLRGSQDRLPCQLDLTRKETHKQAASPKMAPAHAMPTAIPRGYVSYPLLHSACAPDCMSGPRTPTTSCTIS